MSEYPYLLNSHLVTLTQQSPLSKFYPRSTEARLKVKVCELCAVVVQVLQCVPLY